MATPHGCCVRVVVLRMSATLWFPTPWSSEAWRDRAEGLTKRARELVGVSVCQHNTPKMCAWYGMVWYGMVWYGMVWYGMVWYGMVWYGMVQCGMA